LALHTHSLLQASDSQPYSSGGSQPSSSSGCVEKIAWRVFEQQVCFTAWCGLHGVSKIRIARILEAESAGRSAPFEDGRHIPRERDRQQQECCDTYFEFLYQNVAESLALEDSDAHETSQAHANACMTFLHCEMLLCLHPLR
jgi:hypothetical protein